MPRLSYALAAALPPTLSTLALALPPDRVVQYCIHEDPLNAHSAIEYVIAVSLTADSRDGNAIGWGVTNFTLVNKDAVNGDTVWEVAWPFIDTPDGLWWVEHVDPDNPVRLDFVELAPIVDTAFANDPANDAMNFHIEGVPYTPPPEGAPWAVTGALDFSLTAAADPSSSPDDSGDDEPVDLPDWPDDSSAMAQ